ncbi:MAG: hypothetical protein SGCHY_003613, partial [Lobulomycetales sp.]
MLSLIVNLKALGILVAGLSAFLLYNSFTLDKSDIPALHPSFEPSDRRPFEEALDRFSRAIQFKTISGSPNKVFLDFHEFLRLSFPLVHEKLERRVVNELTLIYHWKGKEDSLEPILLMAHQDVVPIASDSSWDYPPFSGAIKDGFVYGRGTLDIKQMLLGELEAVENLLKSEFIPRRSVYLHFGHDEEVGGVEGASVAAKFFQDEGIHFAFILDEGLALNQGSVPGISQGTGQNQYNQVVIASVGVAEKGWVNVQLSQDGTSGHASMPKPSTNSISLLSRAITALQDNPMPATLQSGIIKQTTTHLAPETPFFVRTILANTWLFDRILSWLVSDVPVLNAFTRTTITPTMISGGIGNNILPPRSNVTLNVRILPGETILDVISHIEKTVPPGIKVSYDKKSSLEPSIVSPTTSSAFRMLHGTIKYIWDTKDCLLNTEGLVVAPSLLMGGTDSGKMSRANLSSNVFKFMPVLLKAEDKDIDRIHGPNERVSIENYRYLIRFFEALIVNGQE